MPETVLYGAEFDGSALTDGVQEVVESFEELRKTQSLLEKGIAAFNQTLKLSEAQIAETAAEIKKLDKTNADYAKNLEALEKKLAGQRTQHGELVKSIGDTQNKLVAVTKTVGEYDRATQAVQKSNGEISKQWSKLTNLSGYVGDGIKKLKNHVGDLAIGMVGGLAGGIVSAVIPALVEMVGKLFNASEATSELEKRQKLLSEIYGEASKKVGTQIAQMEIFRNKLNDLSISEEERVRVAKEYNKVADETNQLDTTQINNLTLINAKIDAQNKLLLQRAVSLSATAKLGEFANKFVEASFNVSSRAEAVGLDAASFEKAVKNLIELRGVVVKKFAEGGNRQKLSQQNQEIDKELKRLLGFDFIGQLELFENRDKAEKQLRDATAQLSDLIVVPDTDKKKLPKDKKDKAVREIENDFLKLLYQLKERLAKASASVFQSESLIRKQFEAQLEKEFFQIDELIKKKRLTGDQGDVLKNYLIDIFNIESTKAIEDFKKKQTEVMDRINNEISSASIAAATRRVDNIRDELERERAAIALDYENTAAQLAKALKAVNDKITADEKSGLLDPDKAEKARQAFAQVYGDLLTQAGQDRINRELELAYRSFQDTIKRMQEAQKELDVQGQEQLSADIAEQTDKLLTGQISYKQYQEALTKITKDEARKRRLERLTELHEELDSINKKLAATEDPTIKRRLEEQQRNVRLAIAQTRNEINKGVADDAKEDENSPIARIAQYAQAVNQLLQSVLGFWQQVNEAEARGLERSIALQERRVENAKEIAERGNAEYLELEQKRLDELERKREENARRQLAINNALTVSQATVAAITAISQAVATGSPFAAIAAVAAVVGAIGAAYAFVNSLQPVSASFFEGTEYVQGTGRPLGKDTVPANLHIGERVVRTKENKDYNDALHAIHTRAVPADVLNSFVKHYPAPAVPMVDFGRLGRATDGKIGADSREVVGKLNDLNETMSLVVDVISGLGIGVTMDQEGFSVSLEKKLRERRLRFNS